MSAQVGWSDDPIESISADGLDRGGLAVETAQLIERVTASKGSKVFGLTGPWGSGKTSLALMVETHLKEISSVWKTAHFTPWAATDTGTMMAEFVTSLADILPANEREKLLGIVGQSITLTAPVVAPAVSTATGIPPAVVKSSATKLGKWIIKKDPWEKTFEKLSKELEKSTQKALILVDDIDRLDQAQLSLLLKIIRLLGRFPGIHYLLMYDELTLFETLSAVRDDPSAVRYANRYMEKIVQYQIPVPPMSQYQIAQRVRLGLKNIETRQRRSWDLEDSKFITVMETLEAAFSTPRGIDRYLVQLERVLPLHKPAEIDDTALMLLTVLQTEDPTVYSKLPRLKNYLTFKGAQDFDLVKREINEDEWKELLGASDPWEESLTKQIVNTLFPATSPSSTASHASGNSVRHDVYFDRYFVHTIHGHDVSDSDLNAVLARCLDGDNRSALVDFFQSGLTHEQMWMALGRLKKRTVPKTYDLDSSTTVALVEAVARLLKVLPGNTRDLASPYDRAHFWLITILEHIDPDTAPKDLEYALSHIQDLSDRAEVVTKALRAGRMDFVPDPHSTQRGSILVEIGYRYTDMLTDLLFALLARQRETSIFDHRLASTAYMLSYIGDAQRFQRRMHEDGDEVPPREEIVACFMRVGLSDMANAELIHGINEENLQRLWPDLQVDFSATNRPSLDPSDLTWGNVLTFARLSLGQQTG